MSSFESGTLDLAYKAFKELARILVCNPNSRRALAAKLATTHRWVSLQPRYPGEPSVVWDGRNRASVRRQVHFLPRSVRLKGQAKMQHAKDIKHLRMHPLAFSPGDSLRNLEKTVRRNRAV